MCVNTYNLTAGPCGSSSGSAIVVAANMVAVALATETDGSILCPAARNSVVGIKPTVGLTSRAGVVPISSRQDTVGTMGRTVEDAVAVLDAIVGIDQYDAEATAAAARFIPAGGYRRFLEVEGLKEKRLGILRRGFFDYSSDSVENSTFEAHFRILRQYGAILVDDIEIAGLDTIENELQSGENVALLIEFKLSLNSYLKNLVSSPVRSLSDVIAFNNNHPVEERLAEYGQAFFLAAEKTSGLGETEKAAIRSLAQLSEKGLEKTVKKKTLDAIVFPDSSASSVLAIGGYPGITVPAGYGTGNVPFGISFGGLRGSEPKLIEIAYAFEQATKVRKPPQIAVEGNKETSAAAAAAAAAANFKEATISQIQSAFAKKQLTSRELVLLYLAQIRSLNPQLHAVIETNPDALSAATKADDLRHRCPGHRPLTPLDGIPVLLKDNIATRDRLNTTAGSFALLGSVVPRDATVVRRLRRAGAIILGKASLSEWANFRSINAPDGWSARGGQGRNPYNLTAGPCGSSSGSAIAVAANMVPLALGTETDGSILCPAVRNSVVGIKPTVGLTSRAGVVPISSRQDTVGTMGRTVEDAVAVLDAIVGFDRYDAEATAAAARFIPAGGYRKFLKVEGLKGKRIGILRRGFFDYDSGSVENSTFEAHFRTLRQYGAILVDNIEIAGVDTIVNQLQSGEVVALLAEFKLSLDTYLKNLVSSPVRSLSDVIAFNNNHPVKERLTEYGQAIFLAAENTTGLGETEKAAIRRLAQLSEKGLEKTVKKKSLDAIVFPDSSASSVLAIGGYPGITVPAGYGTGNVPFGISFGGLRGSEPKLIEIAYAFEQATKVRKPPQIAV
ncbi:hypothetical protein M5K25_018600 [Dendrobium thyrsiflorum]|uniref:Amidase domain-containing protein n=1 Tax=Dendrobium thyrsiflorum TaxID=117978 RepID=A0ABD0UJ32_DENTH